MVSDGFKTLLSILAILGGLCLLLYLFTKHGARAVEALARGVYRLIVNAQARGRA